MTGTTEGIEIARKFKGLKIPFVACVVTEYGGQLMEQEGIDAIIGAQDEQGLIQIIKNRDIKYLVDCTHPYAQQASINAISACTVTQTEYIRYQRKGGDIQDSILVSDYIEAMHILNKMEGNIFLTIGSKNLDIFIKEVKEPNRIIARVLPTKEVVEKCINLGLKPHQIIAIKGPFSKELNKALISQFECKILVTKDSGNAGGLDTKIQAAKELDIPALVIGRTKISYPQEFDTADDIINRINELNEQ